jgi:hypothetical protein
MPDFVPDFPTPDWSRPTPSTAPTVEETEAIHHLQAGIGMIQRMTTAIYADEPTAERWTDLGDHLARLSRMCHTMAHNRRRTITPGADPEPDRDHQI